jgi:hypothetical protein
VKQDDPQIGPQQEKTQPQGSVSSHGRSATNNEHETNESDLSHEVASRARRPPTVSLRKIEANRRNARKSTGPKTASGKKRVSTNAIRHGFYAKGLLVPHPDGREDQAEYDDLCLGIRAGSRKPE